jgi:hypothetical protein
MGRSAYQQRRVGVSAFTSSLNADLTMLGRFALALAKARAVPITA